MPEINNFVCQLYLNVKINFKKENTSQIVQLQFLFQTAILPVSWVWSWFRKGKNWILLETTSTCEGLEIHTMKTKNKSHSLSLIVVQEFYPHQGQGFTRWTKIIWGKNAYQNICVLIRPSTCMALNVLITFISTDLQSSTQYWEVGITVSLYTTEKI